MLTLVMPTLAMPALGYTQHRTDLPGRAANIFTMRAYTIGADGGRRCQVAPQLTQEANTWTQFAGWSPDGTRAILHRGWESDSNAAWEEENRTFRFDPGAWLMDCWLVDLASRKAVNTTAVERVSHYNTGLFFWPGDQDRLGFQALIGGESRPFSMRLDGRDKRDLSRQDGFSYGFNASPDGGRIAYHQDYQIYLADADGSQPQRVETGQPFNFVPLWSPDGKWLEFLSGEHYDCHPHLIQRDGTGLRLLAGRGGYEGVVPFLDVEDFHGGSSDVPCWSPDSRWVYYTAQIDGAVELMRVDLEGQIQRLSDSDAGVGHYHPTLRSDGAWLAFGATGDGVRQLYVSRADGTQIHPVTQVAKGHAAMHAHWRPVGQAG
jgi:TolB protein